MKVVKCAYNLFPVKSGNVANVLGVLGISLDHNERYKMYVLPHLLFVNKTNCIV